MTDNIVEQEFSQQISCIIDHMKLHNKDSLGLPMNILRRNTKFYQGSGLSGTHHGYASVCTIPLCDDKTHLHACHRCHMKRFDKLELT